MAPDAGGPGAAGAAALRPGDVVMVKGSLGSRMAHVVEALNVAARPPLRERAVRTA